MADRPKKSDDLIREFAEVRALRNALRRERSGLLCERAEAPTEADLRGEPGPARPDEPCWKAARKWDDDAPRSRMFSLSPPPEAWCETCRRRQVVSDAYRLAVRRHGGALRGLLRRAKTLQPAPAADPAPGETPR